MSGFQILRVGDTNGRMVYLRPRCPSKLDGRRGTRRAWKRENPPGAYMHVVCSLNGEVTREYFTRW